MEEYKTKDGRDFFDEKYKNVEPVEEAAFDLVDEVTGDKLRVVVIKDGYGLNIKPEGYGDGISPVLLDFFTSESLDCGALKVIVWADPDDEEFTHCIGLNKVKNKKEE